MIFNKLKTHTKNIVSLPNKDSFSVEALVGSGDAGDLVGIDFSAIKSAVRSFSKLENKTQKLRDITSILRAFK